MINFFVYDLAVQRHRDLAREAGRPDRLMSEEARWARTSRRRRGRRTR